VFPLRFSDRSGTAGSRAGSVFSVTKLSLKSKSSKLVNTFNGASTTTRLLARFNLLHVLLPLQDENASSMQSLLSRRFNKDASEGSAARESNPCPLKSDDIATAPMEAKYAFGGPINTACADEDGWWSWCNVTYTLYLPNDCSSYLLTAHAED
jgi:hypothetical protein